MRTRMLVLGALVAAGLGACGSGGTDPWTLEVTGAVTLEREGATERLAAGSHEVEEGDRLEVLDGSAVLTLPDDASVELREGRGRSDDSSLLVADVPELLAGEMLLVGAERATTAAAGAATVQISDGALRVRRGASVTVGVYGGEPVLEANGSRLDGLQALRQATITDSGALPRQLQPVTYDRSDLDPWDRRFLGDAIDLDARIEPLQAAVASAAARADVVPVVLAVAGEVAVDTTHSVGESVVGAVIARAAADGDDLAERRREVFSFRDAGASWGLVALDQGAERSEVLGLLDEVVRRLPQRFGGVAAGGGRGSSGDVLALPPPSGGSGTTGPSRPPSGGPSDGGAPDGDDGGSGTPPPTSPPPGPAPTTPPPTAPPIVPLPDVPLLPVPEPEQEATAAPEPVVETVEPVPVVGGIVDGLLDADEALVGG